VKSGLSKVKDLVPSSDEAFTLVSVLSYWHVWQYQAANNNGDDLTGAEKDEYQKDEPKAKFMDVSSKRTSWSDEGIVKFNELMREVKIDRNTAKGKEWESMFQKHVLSSDESGGGKRRATSNTVDPSIEDMSSEDESNEAKRKRVTYKTDSDEEEKDGDIDEDTTKSASSKTRTKQTGKRMSNNTDEEDDDDNDDDNAAKAPLGIMKKKPNPKVNKKKKRNTNRN
jgi:hypothetical protein